MASLNLSDVEGRLSMTPMTPMEGEPREMTLMRRSLRDVPALVERVRELEGRIQFVIGELEPGLPDERVSAVHLDWADEAVADLALAANEKLVRIIYNNTDLTTDQATALAAKIIAAGYDRR